MEKVKKGRPPGRVPLAGERVPLGLRVTAGMKRSLDVAAERSGRSQSQEAELRLELSLAEERSALEALQLVYGPQVAGLLMALGEAMNDAGQLAAVLKTGSMEKAKVWWNDPYAFHQARDACDRLLELASPDGDNGPPVATNLKVGGEQAHLSEEVARRVGRDVSSGLAREIAGEKHAPPHAPERASRIARLLGPLVERMQSKL